MAAQDLVDKAIAAHGGLDRFRSLGEISVRMRCGGSAFAIRFQRGAFARVEASVTTGEPRTVLYSYPEPGKRGVFEPDAVRIESEDGAVIEQRDDPRAAFRGFRHNLWWDKLDLLHFGGYALWNYIATPFVFARPGFELTELDPWEENGERWRRLRVRFPDDVPTHSPEQDFYFDDQGLLRRLDYTAEVFGGWAKAAHYCGEHRDFEGLVVPTRRKVLPRKRNNRPRARPTLVWIEIEDVRSRAAA